MSEIQSAEDARRLREKIMELYRAPLMALDWEKMTDAEIESFAQSRVEPWREALNWVTHLLCGQGKRGGAPESGEIEEATAEARALLSDSTAKEATK